VQNSPFPLLFSSSDFSFAALAHSLLHSAHSLYPHKVWSVSFARALTLSMLYVCTRPEPCSSPLFLSSAVCYGQNMLGLVVAERLSGVMKVDHAAIAWRKSDFHFSQQMDWPPVGFSGVPGQGRMKEKFGLHWNYKGCPILFIFSTSPLAFLSSFTATLFSLFFSFISAPLSLLSYFIHFTILFFFFEKQLLNSQHK
jgi:hypothetical protein